MMSHLCASLSPVVHPVHRGLQDRQHLSSHVPPQPWPCINNVQQFWVALHARYTCATERDPRSALVLHGYRRRSGTRPGGVFVLGLGSAKALWRFCPASVGIPHS